MTEAERQLKKARNQKFVPVAVGRWHVRYVESTATESCESDDSDADEEDEQSTDRPWPRYVYTREVYVRNGLLYCTCGYAQSMLLPCSHIWCVKNLSVSRCDFHFRWALAYQARRIPLLEVPRTFQDQDRGVNMQGVEHPVSLSEDTHYDAHSDVYDHGYDPSDQGRASEDEGHSAPTATHTVSKHLVLLAYPAV